MLVLGRQETEDKQHDEQNTQPTVYLLSLGAQRRRFREHLVDKISAHPFSSRGTAQHRERL
jgi:hypothetical protein